MNGFAAVRILPFLLDAVPVAALVLLAADFLWSRHRCRTEERRLREAISAFEAAGEDPPES